ncbi:hypothetical protein LIZ53_17110, partial [Lachnoclostridium sp. 210928-DFI.6.3]|nr:hypothetical protein [Lachnoclostridium sp. 210928-DFI.6.3]
DHLMIDLLNNDHYQIGDKIQFSLGYKALAQSMFMSHLNRFYLNDLAIEAMCCEKNVKKMNKI